MSRSLVAEFLGTLFLVTAVVGSGIMAASLTTDIAVALLANAVATGAALYWLITVFGPISGAQFNPAVSLWAALSGAMGWGPAGAHVAAQILGGIAGAVLANLMFDLEPLQIATTLRSGTGQWLGEIVATFGLLLTIAGGLRHRPEAVPALVALYITGAYWFTSSTSFANPAVTIARMFSDTFAGIALGSAPVFILCQLIGVALATPVIALLYARERGGSR